MWFQNRRAKHRKQLKVGHDRQTTAPGLAGMRFPVVEHPATAAGTFPTCIPGMGGIGGAYPGLGGLGSLPLLPHHPLLNMSLYTPGLFHSQEAQARMSAGSGTHALGLPSAAHLMSHALQRGLMGDLPHRNGEYYMLPIIN